MSFKLAPHVHYYIGWFKELLWSLIKVQVMYVSNLSYYQYCRIWLIIARCQSNINHCHMVSDTLQNMGCLCLWLMMSFLRARYFDLLLGSPRYHKCKVKWWCWGKRCPWKSKKCLRYNYVKISRTEISDFKVLLIVTWWHSVVFCLGANYSFHKEKAKPAEPITPVVSKVQNSES